MPVKKIQKIKPLAVKEHAGACPTCGHCKCCEKAAKPITLPYIPTVPYSPVRSPFESPFYVTSTGTEGIFDPSQNTSTVTARVQ